MTLQNRIALDIGGANIKLIDSQQRIASCAFPLWQRPHDLADQLRQIASQAQSQKHAAAKNPAQVLATMTGELADCFHNKAHGVAHIVSALEAAFPASDIRIYLTNGQFVAPTAARQHPALAAASNWHALASFVGLQKEWENCVLLDIGSTTCDVIPIVAHKVATEGTTDTTRLQAQELVYLGAERTSVSSIVAELPYRGRACPVARELFATMLDVNLILKNLPSDPDNRDTADGQPATRESAIVRLGRCICADDAIWNEDDSVLAAQHVYDAASGLLESALNTVAQRHNLVSQAPLVLSGHGDFMLSQQTLSNWPQVDRLRHRIGEAASRCAPAYALLQLAEHQSSTETS